MRSFFASCLAGLSFATDNHWAVIVASSYEYEWYLTQSDAAMAYSIIKKNGIPDSNIIYMTPDTIATDVSNPKQGTIYNWPTGPNAYTGEGMDYTGTDVTKANFIGVLKGDTAAVTAGKPVLQTDANSKIFLFYSGGFAQPGCAFFPYETDVTKCLEASELLDTINYMYDNNRYKEMVIYWSSNYSGNMLADLPTDKKVFAVTSTKLDETQVPKYCPPDADIVDDTHIGACLGSQLGTYWLQQSYATDPKTITVAAQAMNVQSQAASEISFWGDMSIIYQPLGDFQGMTEGSSLGYPSFVNYFEINPTAAGNF